MKKPYNGKLGICPDHPCRWIEIWFGMVGGLRTVVVSFKYKNQLRCDRSKLGLLHYFGLWLIQHPAFPYRCDNNIYYSLVSRTILLQQTINQKLQRVNKCWIQPKTQHCCLVNFLSPLALNGIIRMHPAWRRPMIMSSSDTSSTR